MKPVKAVLVDENPQQLRAFHLTLNELFTGSGVNIEAMRPLAALDDYARLLANGEISALILDQKMEDGGIPYSGTQLSSHLRAIAPKLPIFILSNYTDDETLFENGEGSVEYILPKKIIADPTCQEAQTFKARFLRHLDVFTDILDNRAQRYHGLLVKSLTEKLSAEEERELGLLETERVLPTHAHEISDAKAIERAIEEIRKQLNRQ